MWSRWFPEIRWPMLKILKLFQQLLILCHLQCKFWFMWPVSVRSYQWHKVAEKVCDLMLTWCRYVCTLGAGWVKLGWAWLGLIIYPNVHDADFPHLIKLLCILPWHNMHYKDVNINSDCTVYFIWCCFVYIFISFVFLYCCANVFFIINQSTRPLCWCPLAAEVQ